MKNSRIINDMLWDNDKIAQVKLIQSFASPVKKFIKTKNTVSMRTYQTRDGNIRMSEKPW